MSCPGWTVPGLARARRREIPPVCLFLGQEGYNRRLCREALIAALVLIDHIDMLGHELEELRGRGWTLTRSNAESVQHRLLPGRIHLVHYPAAGGPQIVKGARRGTASPGSAVEVAGRVADHTGVGGSPVGPAGEGVEHRLRAGGIQLVHDAIACRTLR